MYIILLLALLLPFLASSTNTLAPPTLKPRTPDQFTELIATGLSETRDFYLGTEIYSVIITKPSDSPTILLEINSRWESPQRQFFLIKTQSKPGQLAWNDPSIVHEVDEKSTYFPFDWERVRYKMGFEDARKLLRQEGYNEKYTEIWVHRPLLKPVGSKSDIFYVFTLEGRDRKVFVGVEDGDVGESSSRLAG